MMDQKKNNNPRDINLEWPVIDEPERAREAVQLKMVTSLLKLAMNDQLPVKLNANLVRMFIQVCHMSSFLERMLHADSTYSAYPPELPMALPEGMVLETLQDLMNPSPTDQLPGVDDIPAVLQRLSQQTVETIDDNFVLNMDEACDQIWNLRETEKRCEQQLEETHDSLQRAALLLEMGRENESYREFQKISQEDIRNNGNTLDLVDLVERFQGKNAALRALKQWFISEICLHPITFDLVADILFPGLRMSKSKRVDFLKNILFNARDLPLEKLRDTMTLMLPSQQEFVLDRSEVESRTRIFGINPQIVDILCEDTEPVCFYNLMTNICSQLNRLANLMLQIDHRISALMAVDRCIIGSLILLFLPPRSEDIQHVIGFGSYNLCHEWIVENLRESHLIVDTLKPQRVHEKNFRKQLLHELDFFLEILEKFVCKSPLPTQTLES